MRVVLNISVNPAPVEGAIDCTNNRLSITAFEEILKDNPNPVLWVQETDPEMFHAIYVTSGFQAIRKKYNAEVHLRGAGTRRFHYVPIDKGTGAI